jgi:thioesterase domain-containing protein
MRASSMTAEFDKEYLQGRIAAEFALARHIGIVVESADERGIVLRAPLAANSNYKGTAFGGSLFSVAVLAGWCWVTRFLAQHNMPADAVIQGSTIDYLLPVSGELHAIVAPPLPAQIEKFEKMLQRAGRGRICLCVEIHYEQRVATRFEGVFAAAVRS